MTSCGLNGCLLRRFQNGAPIRVNRGFPPGVRSNNAPVGECRSEERNYPCPRVLKGVHVPVRRGFPVGFGGHDSFGSKETSVGMVDDDEIDPSLADLQVTRDDEQSHFDSAECGSEMKHKDDLVGDGKMVDGGDEVVVGSLEWNAARAQVMEAINLFRESFLRLSRQRKLIFDRARNSHAGIHLEVAKLLRVQGKSLNTTKQLGTVLGVEVGDRFKWRAELCVVGLHHQPLRGIDYTLKDGKLLATSIVDSGRYPNDSADGSFLDSLIYLGEGGKAEGCGKVIGDQKLKGGNFALKNSMKAKTPVRVIRKMRLHGTDDEGCVFVYDGLYFVESYSREQGESSKQVFKFLLKRMPEQSMVSLKNLGNLVKDSTQGNKSRRRKRKFSSLDEQVLLEDITQGGERKPIPVRNALDNELPQSFKYIADMIYPEYHDFRVRNCCDCIDDCSNSSECPCVKRNGGELPYNYEGHLINAKQTVYECGPSCRCSGNCINRVSQHGICYRLELFKTESKGWGVRSQSHILCGSFICEYIGLVIDDEEAEERTGKDDYLFDIGLNYGKQQLAGKRGDGFTIDAAHAGNVSRFINHSCSPNLFVQNVLYDHDDEMMPHIMLFSMEDISPLEELTYDYNYKPGQVCDANGDTKMKPCHCGSIDCTGRMY